MKTPSLSSLKKGSSSDADPLFLTRPLLEKEDPSSSSGGVVVDQESQSPPTPSPFLSPPLCMSRTHENSQEETDEELNPRSGHEANKTSTCIIKNEQGVVVVCPPQEPEQQQQQHYSYHYCPSPRLEQQKNEAGSPQKLYSAAVQLATSPAETSQQHHGDTSAGGGGRGGGKSSCAVREEQRNQPHSCTSRITTILHNRTTTNHLQLPYPSDETSPSPVSSPSPRPEAFATAASPAGVFFSHNAQHRSPPVHVFESSSSSRVNGVQQLRPGPRVVQQQQLQHEGVGVGRRPPFLVVVRRRREDYPPSFSSSAVNSESSSASSFFSRCFCCYCFSKDTLRSFGHWTRSAASFWWLLSPLFLLFTWFCWHGIHALWKMSSRGSGHWISSEMAGDEGVTMQRDYGVVIDAGSHGSRLSVYSWKPRLFDPSHPFTGPVSFPTLCFRGLPQDALTSPQQVPSILSALIDEGAAYLHIHAHIPELRWSDFPLYLKATGGMRNMEQGPRDILMETIRDYLANRQYNPFRFQRSWARVLAGEEEGVYGWLAVNSGRNSLIDDPARTTGALDLGGASAQITFFPTHTSVLEDLTLVRLGDRTIRLYSHSYLGYGWGDALSRVSADLAVDELLQRLKANPGFIKEYVRSARPLAVRRSGKHMLEETISSVDAFTLFATAAKAPQPSKRQKTNSKSSTYLSMKWNTPEARRLGRRRNSSASATTGVAATAASTATATAAATATATAAATATGATTTAAATLITKRRKKTEEGIIHMEEDVQSSQDSSLGCHKREKTADTKDCVEDISDSQQQRRRRNGKKALTRSNEIKDTYSEEKQSTHISPTSSSSFSPSSSSSSDGWMSHLPEEAIAAEYQFLPGKTDERMMTTYTSVGHPSLSMQQQQEGGEVLKGIDVNNREIECPSKGNKKQVSNLSDVLSNADIGRLFLLKGERRRNERDSKETRRKGVVGDIEGLETLWETYHDDNEVNHKVVNQIKKEELPVSYLEEGEQEEEGKGMNKTEKNEKENIEGITEEQKQNMIDPVNSSMKEETMISEESPIIKEENLEGHYDGISLSYELVFTVEHPCFPRGTIYDFPLPQLTYPERRYYVDMSVKKIHAYMRAAGYEEHEIKQTLRTMHRQDINPQEESSIYDDSVLDDTSTYHSDETTQHEQQQQQQQEQKKQEEVNVINENNSNIVSSSNIPLVTQKENHRRLSVVTSPLLLPQQQQKEEMVDLYHEKGSSFKKEETNTLVTSSIEKMKKIIPSSLITVPSAVVHNSNEEKRNNIAALRDITTNIQLGEKNTSTATTAADDENENDHSTTLLLLDKNNTTISINHLKHEKDGGGTAMKRQRKTQKTMKKVNKPILEENHLSKSENSTTNIHKPRIHFIARFLGSGDINACHARANKFLAFGQYSKVHAAMGLPANPSLSAFLEEAKNICRQRAEHLQLKRRLQGLSAVVYSKRSAVKLCWKAIWSYAMLRDGFGFPASSTNISFAPVPGDSSADAPSPEWATGSMIAEVNSYPWEVPPETYEGPFHLATAFLIMSVILALILYHELHWMRRRLRESRRPRREHLEEAGGGGEGEEGEGEDGVEVHKSTIYGDVVTATEQ